MRDCKKIVETSNKPLYLNLGGSRKYYQRSSGILLQKPVQNVKQLSCLLILPFRSAHTSASEISKTLSYTLFIHFNEMKRRGIHFKRYLLSITIKLDVTEKLITQIKEMYPQNSREIS